MNLQLFVKHLHLTKLYDLSQMVVTLSSNVTHLCLFVDEDSSVAAVIALLKAFPQLRSLFLEVCFFLPLFPSSLRKFVDQLEASGVALTRLEKFTYDTRADVDYDNVQTILRAMPNARSLFIRNLQSEVPEQLNEWRQQAGLHAVELSCLGSKDLLGRTGDWGGEHFLP